MRSDSREDFFALSTFSAVARDSSQSVVAARRLKEGSFPEHKEQNLSHHRRKALPSRWRASRAVSTRAS